VTRLVVTGSRDWTDRAVVEEALRRLPVGVNEEPFLERGVGWTALMDASCRGEGHGWCFAHCLRGLSLSAARQRGADCGGSSDLAAVFGLVGGPAARDLPAPVDDVRTETRAVGW
jgi:hypothetical protein